MKSVNIYRLTPSMALLLVVTSVGVAEAQSLQPDSFNPGAGGNTLAAFAVQADGKIVVGGAFTTLAGQARNRIGRLSAEGALDAAFNPQADATVYSLAIQPR